MSLNDFRYGLTAFTLELILLQRGDSEIALGHQFCWLVTYERGHSIEYSTGNPD